jgi:DNA-binding HxlR family transcriptional regulator
MSALLEVFGTRCLAVLSDEATLAILLHLCREALSPSQIEASIDGIGYRVALARLRLLRSRGLVELVDGADGHRRRRVPHRLTASGRALLTVLDAAAGCEDGWPRPPGTFGPPGSAALGVAADPACRAIARSLAHDRLSASDLGMLLPEISHGTLSRRLRHCTALGLLETEQQGRGASLSLTDAARRLASVALAAARWEWVFDERDKGLLASDLAGLIHQVAPLARVAEDVNGVCKLHEAWHTTLQSDVYLAVGGGRLTPFVVAPLGPWDVVARGDPQQWWEAIVGGDLSRIDSTGSRPLLEAVIAGLSPGLRARAL